MSGKDDPKATPGAGNGPNRHEADRDKADRDEAANGADENTPAAGFAGGPTAPQLNPEELARQRAADEGMEPPYSEETEPGEAAGQEQAGAAAGPEAEPAGDGAAEDAVLDGDDAVEDPHRALQRAILDAALPHIAFDGWTRDVLVQAAVEAGFDEGDADLAFPGGPVEAVLAHAAIADDDMVAEMGTLDLDAMRTRDKIAIAIRVRLEAQFANREAIRRGLRLLADPRHAPQAAKSLARTVDTLWRIAGDTATDFNYYTKRGLLAGVYSATLVYWLQDNSEDQHRTWEFLNRRIGEVLRFGQAASGFGKIADRLPNPFRLCGGGRRRWREGPVHR